tara:strand:+ start:1637 stop:2911 length:1275 start_codon:yes stop_codon:yes gene_type:complete
MKYKVFKHQNKFIRTKEKFPALVAGYGSGKTFALCLKAIIELGRNPGKIVLLAEPTFPMMRDVLQPTLEELLKDLGFAFKYVAGETKYNISWKNGYGSIILRSAENWKRWAGLNLAAFGIDEAALLKTDHAWKMGISRLRDGYHLTGFTTTTPEGFNWHYDYWKKNPKSGYKLFNGRTTDNKYLPQEFIDSLLDNYDAKLVKAYLNGEYVNMQHGQAYYMFDRRKNVKPTLYNPDKKIIFCIDFNVEPMCGCIIQVYKEHPKIRVIDEIVITHQGENELMTERIVRILKAKYPKSKYDKADVFKRHPIRDNYICYPDPSGQAKSTSAKATDHDILRRGGMLVKAKKHAPYVVDRLNSVNKAFDTMVVDPRCKALIQDFEQVALKEHTRELDKSNPQLTHMSDAIGYFIDYEFPCRKVQTRTFMA